MEMFLISPPVVFILCVNFLLNIFVNKILQILFLVVLIPLHRIYDTSLGSRDIAMGEIGILVVGCKVFV